MKKKVSKSKKKMTLEKLASDMMSSFKTINKKLTEHDNYFNSIAKTFQSIEKRFEKIDQRFDKIDQRFENLELGQKKIHQEILNVHDTFVKRSEFDNLAQRLSRVEQKLRTKLK